MFVVILSDVCFFLNHYYLKDTSEVILITTCPHQCPSYVVSLRAQSLVQFSFLYVTLFKGISYNCCAVGLPQTIILVVDQSPIIFVD